MSGLWSDLKFAVRMLVKNPGFTVVVVLTFALGIGANTGIFTVANTLFLRPLPVDSPGQLVQLLSNDESHHSFPYALYERFRDDADGLSDLFAAGGVERNRLFVPMESGAGTEFFRTQLVSGNFFSVLRVFSLIGRTLTPEDDQRGNPQPVAVISHNFWQRRFGSDPSVVGKSITVNEVSCTIVGVAPSSFFGFQPGENPDLWLPLQMVRQIHPKQQRLENDTWLRLIGRLAPEEDRTQAQAELDVIFQRHLNEIAAIRTDWSVEQRRSYLSQRLVLQPSGGGWTTMREQFRGPIFILSAVVAVVLVIACANVAGLMLVRFAARQREFSVRGALGAGRFRIISQLLTESMLLSILGGVSGFFIAQWGAILLLSFMQVPQDSVSFDVAPDSRVLTFMITVSLLTGLLTGLVYAFCSSRLDLIESLKGNAISAAGGRSRQKLNKALVVMQVALSVVLLICAGLFIHTLRNFEETSLGFDREHIVFFEPEYIQKPDTARLSALHREMAARLQTLPGVSAVSYFSQGFLSDSRWVRNVSTQEASAISDPNQECLGVRAGTRFFETLGMTLLAGRDFSEQDEQAGAPRVAVINQSMARRYFGETNPLGKHFFFTHQPEQKIEVVGIVKDAKYGSLREKFLPTFYLPFFQEPDSEGGTFAVRSRGGAQALAVMGELSSLARSVDPTLRIRRAWSVEDMVNASIHQERVIAQVGSFFAFSALGLACLGLYGLLSFSVTQRTSEFGVRIALGAQANDVLSLVIGKGLKLVFTGAALGLAAAFAITRVFASLLYGVEPVDPATFFGVLTLLLLVAVAASYIPARRAAKIDPITALRCE